MTKIALTLLAVVFLSPAFSQNGRDVTILLKVKTEDIRRGEELQNVSIKDESLPSESGFGNADTFEIEIYQDHKVIWKAVSSSNPNHKVEITKMRKKFLWKGKNNVLVKRKNKDNNNDGIVNARGKSDWKSDKDVELYWIKFEITKGSGPPIKCKLDPKIRIKPK